MMTESGYRLVDFAVIVIAKADLLGSHFIVFNQKLLQARAGRRELLEEFLKKPGDSTR